MCSLTGQSGERVRETRRRLAVFRKTFVLPIEQRSSEHLSVLFPPVELEFRGGLDGAGEVDRLLI